MKTLKDMSGEELESKFLDLVPLGRVSEFRLELRRRLELAGRISSGNLEPHGISLLLAEQARVSELIADRNAAESERDQARAERDALNENIQNWGIVEIAVRNMNVASYVEHWESRALAAENSLSTARTALTGAQIDFNFIAGLAQGREEMHSVFGQIERTALLAAKYALAALNPPEEATTSEKAGALSAETATEPRKDK